MSPLPGAMLFLGVVVGWVAAIVWWTWPGRGRPAGGLD